MILKHWSKQAQTKNLECIILCAQKQHINNICLQWTQQNSDKHTLIFSQRDSRHAGTHTHTHVWWTRPEQTWTYILIKLNTADTNKPIRTGSTK